MIIMMRINIPGCDVEQVLLGSGKRFHNICRWWWWLLFFSMAETFPCIFSCPSPKKSFRSMKCSNYSLTSTFQFIKCTQLKLIESNTTVLQWTLILWRKWSSLYLESVLGFQFIRTFMIMSTEAVSLLCIIQRIIFYPFDRRCAGLNLQCWVSGCLALLAAAPSQTICATGNDLVSGTQAAMRNVQPTDRQQFLLLSVFLYYIH